MLKKSVTSLLLIPVLLLSSCSKVKEYRDGVPCDDITKAVIQAVPTTSGYSEYGDEQIKYSFENTDIPDDYTLIYSTDSNDINEIGIFHTPDSASAVALCETVQHYLDDMKETQTAFIAGYAAEELPKLDAAKAEVFGNYVVYFVLSEEDREKAIDAITTMIEK